MTFTKTYTKTFTKKIIGIGRHKNVGKDTFANFCIDVLRSNVRGMRIVKRGFADKIYEFLYSTYQWAGFKPKAYYDEDPKRKNEVLKNGKIVRDMLIEVGTPVMRAYDNDIWINANLLNEDYDTLFIPDLRFPNEFEAVEKLGGVLVNIKKPGLPIPTDVADTALNGWDHRWHMTYDNCHEKSEFYKFAEKFTWDNIIGNSNNRAINE